MENLIEWRKRNGITQAAFADRLGVSNSALAKYESGKLRLKPELAMRIEALTGGQVSTAVLLGLTRAMGVREVGTGYQVDAVGELVERTNDPFGRVVSEGPKIDYDNWIKADRERFAANAHGLEEAVKRKRIEHWNQENREAIESWNEHYREHGLWNEKYRLF